MNSYEAKQSARKARYEERAERAEQQSSRLYKQARDMASAIPFGQPILVGHHSEKRDRNYRNRIHNTFGKAFAEHDKAKHYATKAASVGTAGVSSDDPDAVDKLKTKLARMESMQTTMREANKLVRRHLAGKMSRQEYVDAAVQYVLTAAVAEKLLEPDFAGRPGFPDYQLTNNNANINRIKKRIASLEQAAVAETVEVERQDGVRVVENVEENRLQIFFPGKPSAEVRANLKSRGFRWSPNAGAWQRHLSNSARWAADCVLKDM